VVTHGCWATPPAATVSARACPTWTVADKTGAGSYGANNNAGIAWTPDGTPIVVAMQVTKPERDAAWDHALIAETAAVLAGALG
jgi:beta-lactamase class A